MNKRNTICCVLFIFITSCSTMHHTLDTSSLIGVYTQKERPGIKLYLNKTNFALRYDIKPFHVARIEYEDIDTVAFGKWKLAPNNYISLTSLSDYLMLKMKVTESVADKDSVVINFDNPLERYLKQSHRKKGNSYYVGYILEVETSDGHAIFRTLRNKSHFAIKAKSIRNFSIYIQTSYYIIGRSVAKSSLVLPLTYQVKNPEANVFNIELPQLNFPFLYRSVLQDEYIRVKNRHVLIWHGKEYIKQ